MVTQPPSRSTTETWVVSGRGPPALSRGTRAFTPRSISAASPAACSRPVSRSTGTSTKRGSPTWRSLSMVARFMVSATIRTYSAELCSSEASGKCSSTFSISSSMTPPPGGRLLDTR